MTSFTKLILFAYVLFLIPACASKSGEKPASENSTENSSDRPTFTVTEVTSKSGVATHPWNEVKLPSVNLDDGLLDKFALQFADPQAPINLLILSPDKVSVDEKSFSRKNFRFPLLISYRANALKVKKLDQDFKKKSKKKKDLISPHRFLINIKLPSGETWSQDFSQSELMGSKTPSNTSKKDSAKDHYQSAASDSILKDVYYRLSLATNLSRLIPSEKIVFGAYEIEVQIYGATHKSKTELVLTK